MHIEIKINSLEKYLANLVNEIEYKRITDKLKELVTTYIQGTAINNGKIGLVVGARSSLFLPFKNLGLIVVDEEHDTSYKQDEGIRYNARDMAISRGSFENVPVILSTSIPSLETYKNVKSKKYNVTKLKKRYKDFSLPNAEIQLNPSELALLQRLLGPQLPKQRNGELMGPKEVWLKLLAVIECWIENHLQRKISSLNMLRVSLLK